MPHDVGIFASSRRLQPTARELSWLAGTGGPFASPTKPSGTAIDPTPPTATWPALEIRDAPGKGKGLFAAESIQAFTPVLADHTLLSLAVGEDLPQLWERYLLLPADLQHSFDTLSFSAHRKAHEPVLIEKLVQRGYDRSTAQKMARVSSVFHANAFKTGATEASMPVLPLLSAAVPSKPWSYALFASVARINHSCTPNAHAHYDAASGRQIVVTLSSISADEELSIAYFDPTMPRSLRKSRASSAWGFECACPACVMGDLAISSVADDYEDQLSTVHAACTADVELHALGGPVKLHALMHRVQSGIGFALDSRTPWLSAASPRLYLRLAAVLRALGKSSDEVEAAITESNVWERRILGPAGI